MPSDAPLADYQDYHHHHYVLPPQQHDSLVTSPVDSVTPRRSHVNSLLSTGAANGCMPPTWRGFIHTTLDALIVLEACLEGKLSHIPRRPHDRERAQIITSGNVFIYEENASGIKRWTDGVTWSPSRIMGNFLVYRELNEPFPAGEKKKAKKRKRSTEDEEARLAQQQQAHSEEDRKLVGSLVDSYGFKPNGLIKKTLNVNFNGVNHHIVSYYSLEDVKRGAYQRPKFDQRISNLSPRQALINNNFKVGCIDPDEDTYAIDPFGPNLIHPVQVPVYAEDAANTYANQDGYLYQYPKSRAEALAQAQLRAQAQAQAQAQAHHAHAHAQAQHAQAHHAQAQHAQAQHAQAQHAQAQHAQAQHAQAVGHAHIHGLPLTPSLQLFNNDMPIQQPTYGHPTAAPVMTHSPHNDLSESVTPQDFQMSQFDYQQQQEQQQQTPAYVLHHLPTVSPPHASAAHARNVRMDSVVNGAPPQVKAEAGGHQDLVDMPSMLSSTMSDPSIPAFASQAVSHAGLFAVQSAGPTVHYPIDGPHEWAQSEMPLRKRRQIDPVTSLPGYTGEQLSNGFNGSNNIIPYTQAESSSYSPPLAHSNGSNYRL